MPLDRPGDSPRGDNTTSPTAGAPNHSPRRQTSADEPSTELFANLDPSLHPATLNSVSTDAENPLTHFAQHVLDDHGGGLLGFNSIGSGEDSSLFTASGEARFGELLEAADQSERVIEQPTNGDHHEPFAFDGAGPGDHLDPSVSGVAPDTDEHGVKMGRLVGRTKRRRDGEEIVVGPVENGEPIDPIKLKKDSHKEVERRRRENINDGINEIARYIPGGMEKVGKGLLLRRAAEYLGELTLKMQRIEEDQSAKDREKQTLQDELSHVQARLDEEHARSIRFETSWREAEDRAASSQFELDRLKTELDELKKKHGEN